MTNRKAIVTMTMGAEYERFWEIYCEANWVPYAARNGYDLIRLPHSLDDSALGRSRSPSWQKCLILGQDFASRYERIVWIDADIVINLATAPDIVGDSPPERVGGVLTSGHLPDWAQAVVVGRYFKEAEGLRGHADFIASQRATFGPYGYRDPPDRNVQCGVLVMSPAHHRELMESIYYAPYPDQSRLYEQPPVSYELLTKDLFHAIDPRFNYTLLERLLLNHPWLTAVGPYQRLRDLCASPGMGGFVAPASLDQLLQYALVTEFYNAYFFHFAGTSNMAPLLPSSLYKMAPPPVFTDQPPD